LKVGDKLGLVSQSGKGYKYLDEKAVTRDSLGFQVNSLIMIEDGKYRGMEGVILSIKGDVRGDRKFKVELTMNGQVTSLHESQISMF